VKCLYQIINCELYSYSSELLDSRMYIIISNNKALIIDPCVNADALQLMNDKKVRDVIILPTHEHYDHISGINWIKEYFTCRLIAINHCARNLQDPKGNASAYFDALIFLNSPDSMEQIENIQPYSCEADETFADYKCFNWENHKIEIIYSPGHSVGSVCILIDYKFIFTGDSLIKGKPTITRLPGGSKKKYFEITVPFLKSLPKDSIIYPGHGEIGFIHEFSME
jgi:hydroxyacylglutathione hydrolase